MMLTTLFVSPRVGSFLGKKMPLSTESSGALEFRQRSLGSVFFVSRYFVIDSKSFFFLYDIIYVYVYIIYIYMYIYIHM